MDEDLILAASLADDLDRAFPRLVAAHAGRLYTIALRCLGVPSDAEEVAQDALVRAHAALVSYGPIRIRDLALRPWLATITINLARNRRRRIADRRPPTRLDPLVEAGWEPREPTRSQPSAVAERREAERELVTALMALRTPIREAVVLRHIDGLSVAETAASLRRPEGTIKAQVHRGLAILRRQLEIDARAASRVEREMTA